MKKFTKKESKTYLTGVQMSGKEFVKMFKEGGNDSFDLYEWNLPLKDVDGDPIVVSTCDDFTIEGPVTIMFNTKTFEEDGTELPQV